MAEVSVSYFKGTYPGLTIDPVVSQPNVGLALYPDIYQNDFAKQSHLNWIVKEEKDTYVLSIMVQAQSSVLRGLKTTSKGYQEFSVRETVDPTDAALLKGSLLEQGVIDSPLAEFIFVTDPGFPQDLQVVEQRHPQARAVMKIGVIYSKKGETTAAQMFENKECSPDFWKFIDRLGEKIDLEGWTKYRGDMRPPGNAWYSVWKGIEIIYHVAPILNAEEKRRLIGNDIGMLFYFDEPLSEKFDPSGIDTFGEVPCVFAVVQPDKKKSEQEQYQVGFCSKINITSHTPQSPAGTQNFDDTVQATLTKLHNGLVKTIFCPPMNRLFMVPRRATLNEITEKYILIADKDKEQPVGAKTEKRLSGRFFGERKKEAGKDRDEMNKRATSKEREGEASPAKPTQRTRSASIGVPLFKRKTPSTPLTPILDMANSDPAVITPTSKDTKISLPSSNKSSPIPRRRTSGTCTPTGSSSPSPKPERTNDRSETPSKSRGPSSLSLSLKLEAVRESSPREDGASKASNLKKTEDEDAFVVYSLLSARSKSQNRKSMLNKTVGTSAGNPT